ncbi:MAG: DNA repair protein RadA [Desulfovibrionaceae bacterium]
MAKSKDIYVCSSCLAEYKQWKGQCQQCQEWNTLERQLQSITKTKTPYLSAAKAVALCDVSLDEMPIFSSGITALDNVLGNGLVPGGVLLFGGEPGVGKSTLLLQLAGNVAKQGKVVLYVSGEESLSQISARANRLDVGSATILVLSTSHLDDIISQIKGSEKKPSLLIIDSIQTIASSSIEGLAGNINQVRGVATALIELCKEESITLLLIGHITKDGAIAGPKLLEHLVDTVLSFEGDRKRVFRMLRVLKNRFGPTQEIVLFQMQEMGLSVIDDPSTYFLEDRDPTLSGTAIVMTLDGQLPFAIEVQALVTRSFLAMPRRIALGYDSNRLTLLLAVLEKRLKCNFGQLDIHTKIGGGIRLQDPAIDLGLIVAILSSLYDIALPERSIFWGEVDLNGQIRPVVSHGLRYEQAQRLGYAPIIAPKDMKAGISHISELSTLFKRKQKND